MYAMYEIGCYGYFYEASAFEESGNGLKSRFGAKRPPPHSGNTSLLISGS
jgi:hypothetical protein